ncbi:MAG: hypothetical protein LKF81_10990 [Prevotella sp.]|nr:hypothetical protein [Prevotella sp.]
MSKIIMCCPFYNENLLANLNIEEASKWVDEIHLTECNKSFKYTDHPYCFHLNHANSKVFYHQLNASKYYLRPRKIIPHIIVHPVSRWMKHCYRNTAWYNEGISRNHSLWNCQYSDEDILVLSDVDEIIDSNYADEIVENVRKKGVVTIELYFTVFYFNLWCPKFSGPKYYSYRIFIIKGAIMRKRFHNDSDYLRKLGERGLLTNKVECLHGIKGFHHSWLGDENFVVNKFNSFAHNMGDGFDGISDKNGQLSIAKLKEHLHKGKSIFKNAPLILKDDMPFIQGVNKLKIEQPQYFL